MPGRVARPDLVTDVRAAGHGSCALDHLQKLFERLKKYKLRLNPNKCTFGVRSGKLLGFVVSNKGIEVVLPR